MEVSNPKEDPKKLEHLGLIAAMCKELKIAEKINSLFPPSAPDKKVSTGDATVAMVINAMGFGGTTLYMTAAFYGQVAHHSLLPEHIKPEYMTDDTLGNALDKIFDIGPDVVFLSVTREIFLENNQDFKNKQEKGGESKEKCIRVGLDSSSMYVHGAYNGKPGPKEVEMRYGHSKDGRPDLLQINFNVFLDNITGYPIMLIPANGNQSDKKAFPDLIAKYIEQFRIPDEEQYIIVDSALHSKEGIKKIGKIAKYITRAPFTSQDAREASQNVKEWQKIDENYSYYETNHLTGEVEERWVIIKSSEKYKKDIIASEKAWQKIEIQQKKDLKKLQSAKFNCEKDAQEAVEKVKGMGIHEIIKIPVYAKRGKPIEAPVSYKYRVKVAVCACWSIAQKQSLRQNAGIIILATNELDRNKLTAIDVLKYYKGQHKVEKGFRFLKDPYFFADAFYLKKESRIMSLLMVMGLSLLVYNMLENRIRAGLKKENKFYPNQSKKFIQNPSARWVFFSFQGIMAVPLHDKKYRISGLKKEHITILEILGQNFASYYT